MARIRALHASAPARPRTGCQDSQPSGPAITRRYQRDHPPVDHAFARSGTNTARVAEIDLDLAAIQGAIADVLDGDGDGDRAVRKALLQTLIAKVRVESRDAITPSVRVPLQARVRIVSESWGEDSNL
jgi:hypothetical protein